MSQLATQQEGKILNDPAAMNRFNDVAVVILSGFIGRLKIVSNDRQGQVAIIVVLVIALP